MHSQTFKVVNGVYVGPKVWEGHELSLRMHKHSLTSLGCLQAVEGNLDVERFTNLVDLGDLTTVKGFLDLGGCHNLTTLGKLTTVNTLDVEHCHNLISLGNLTTVKGDLRIIRCDKLSSIGNLTTLRGDVVTGECFIGATLIPGGRFWEQVTYYKELPLHEALNAIHSKEVQSTPLYRNILLNKMQGHNTLP